MGAKITFDADARKFVVIGPPVDGVISINLNIDLYSDGKEDWLDDTTYPDLSKMRFPVDAKGGEPFGSITLGDSYLITDGWTFQPYEADHTLQFDGNVGTDDGRQLVDDTVGAFRVRVENIVSSIVQVREGPDATLVRKILDNALDTDPTTGKMVLYDDDGVTAIREWDIYEDIAKTQPYRSQGTERRDPPTVP